MDKSKKPALLDRPRGMGMKSMKRLNKFKVITVLAAVPLLSTFFYPAASHATGPVITQGTTSSFGLLAASTITGNAGITGTAGSSIGVSGGTPPTGTLAPSGTVYLGAGPATTAQTELVTAIGDVNAPAATSAIADTLAT